MKKWHDDRHYDCSWMHPDQEVFADLGAAAECFGTTTRNIMRWIAEGVGEELADRIAVAVGKLPRDIWPEWEDVPEDWVNEPIGIPMFTHPYDERCSICNPRQVMSA